MKKVIKWFSILLFYFFLILATSAEDFKNMQKIYSASDTVYTDIETLYIATGLALPSSSGPWSGAELDEMLSYLHPEKLSVAMRNLYDSVYNVLNQEPEHVYEDTLGLSIKSIFTPELYIQTNATEFNQESDWEYGFEDREASYQLPIQIWAANLFYLRSDLSIGIDSGTITDDDVADKFYSTDVSCNIYPVSPAEGNDFDMNMPYRTTVSFGGNHWNFALGRDVISWGNGETGNLVVGGNAKYDNYAHFSAFYHTFKFTTLGILYPHPEMTSETSQNQLFDGTKVFLSHRAEVTTFQDKLSLGLTESIMYQSADNTFDFRIYNPLNAFHNYYIRGNANSIIALDVNFALYSGWSFYGQVVVDEFSMPTEPSASDGEKGSHPDAVGFLMGVKNAISIGDGILKSSLEGVLNSSYLYLREEYNSDTETFGVSFYGDYRDFSDGVYYYSYSSGYTYGGDCVVGQVRTTYTVPKKWGAGIEFFYMAHGIIDSAADYGDGTLDGGEDIPFVLATTSPLNDEDPEKTGEIEHIFRISLCGSYYVLDTLKPYIRTDFFLIKNKDNEAADFVNDIQFTLGLKYIL